MTVLENAWAANATLGWLVGRPYEHDEMTGNEWEQHAYDPREKPKVGKRSPEWTAIAPTELACIHEMARCLREISAGRVPR